MNQFFSKGDNKGQSQNGGHLYVAYLNKTALNAEYSHNVQGTDAGNSFFFSSYIAENGIEVPAILSREDEMKLFDEYY